MAHPELYLNLNYNQKIIFSITIIAIVIIIQILTRLKNKAQKRTIKQITHKTTKIDLCRNFVANMQQEFVGQRKVIFNELVRM